MAEDCHDVEEALQGWARLQVSGLPRINEYISLVRRHIDKVREFETYWTRGRMALARRIPVSLT